MGDNASVAIKEYEITSVNTTKQYFLNFLFIGFPKNCKKCHDNNDLRVYAFYKSFVVYVFYKIFCKNVLRFLFYLELEEQFLGLQ